MKRCNFSPVGGADTPVRGDDYGYDDFDDEEPKAPARCGRTNVNPQA